MERIAQYLDELEDLVYAFFIVKERLLRVLRVVLMMVTSLLLQALGVLLALSQPPLALAAVSLMVVGMLYNFATTRSQSGFAAS